MKKNNLILASQSPQRKRILSELGVTFSVLPADIDEHHAHYKRPHDIVQSIAWRKAQAIGLLHPGAWVIGSDTIVVLKNGDIALKPRDESDARKMLQHYRNSFCHVYSGLALFHAGKRKKQVGYLKTTLYFSDFSSEAIETYLSSGRWKDCSGALTIEERLEWIDEVKGDYWNVVGLPVPLLKNFLQEADLI